MKKYLPVIVLSIFLLLLLTGINEKKKGYLILHLCLECVFFILWVKETALQDIFFNFDSKSVYFGISLFYNLDINLYLL